MLLIQRDWRGLPRSPGGREQEGVGGVVTLTGAGEVPAVRDAVGGSWVALAHMGDLCYVGSSHMLVLLQSSLQILATR